jgi:hypothetical protein
MKFLIVAFIVGVAAAEVSVTTDEVTIYLKKNFTSIYNYSFKLLIFIKF